MIASVRPSLSIVVPAFNEEASIAETAARCLSVLEEWAGEYELVILDDGSHDSTASRMEEIRAQHPGVVRTIVHPVNLGIAVTFEHLYREARKDFVWLIPADGQYPPEVLPEVMSLLATHDVVILRRTRKLYTPGRMLVSRAYRWLPQLLFGVDLIDPGSSKCLSRELIDRIPVRSTGVFVEAERIIRAARQSCRIAHVDIVQAPRKGGQALGAKPSMVIGALRDLAWLWFDLNVRRGSSSRAATRADVVDAGDPPAAFARHALNRDGVAAGAIDQPSVLEDSRRQRG